MTTPARARQPEITRAPAQTEPRMPKLAYSIPEAASAIGVSPRLVWQFIAKGVNLTGIEPQGKIARMSFHPTKRPTILPAPLRAGGAA